MMFGGFGSWQFVFPAGPTEAQRAAKAIDDMLETHAAASHGNAIETGDQRWTSAALALLGARRFFRELMHEDDRK